MTWIRIMGSALFGNVVTEADMNCQKETAAVIAVREYFVQKR